MMQLDVEALRTLLVVVDHGSITKAAAILHVTRSAASWRIKRLEEHVGQELLVRDGREIRPSRAARVIVDDVRSLVETHDRITRSLDNADLTGAVTVGADSDADVPQLTRILGSFRRVHPGVDVNLRVDRAVNIRAGIDSGEVDIALIQGIDEHLRSTDRILWTDDLVWVTGTCCSHDDGEVVPLVAFGDDCFYREIGEPMLDAAGIDYRVALSVPSTEGVVASVEGGLGVAIIPRHNVTDRLEIWEPTERLPVLPRVHAFARISPDDASETVGLLVDLIADELCEPGMESFSTAS
ncbi:MAG: LysR family transcriptional regulator [Actinomycetota bacterium]